MTRMRTAGSHTSIRVVGLGGITSDVTPAGIREIAARVGVTPAAVSNRIARDPSFPAPWLRVQSGPVYDLDQVLEYWYAPKKDICVQSQDPGGDHGA